MIEKENLKDCAVTVSGKSIVTLMQDKEMT